MKLKLEVSYVDSVPRSVVFKPLDCGLQGDLVYKGLPQRAIDQLKVGQVLEATIPLPEHYPVPGPDHHHKKRENAHRDLQHKLEHLGYCLAQMEAEYNQGICEIRQFGATANLFVEIDTNLKRLKNDEFPDYASDMFRQRLRELNEMCIGKPYLPTIAEFVTEGGQCADLIQQLSAKKPEKPAEKHLHALAAPLETKFLGDKWYKRCDSFPHNWEPIQEEIQEALKRAHGPAASDPTLRVR